jgi:hypothetical protein
VRLPLPSPEKLAYFKLIVETLILLVLIAGVGYLMVSDPRRAMERLLKGKDL